MKRIICAALALVMCAGVAVGASGCGCKKSDKTASTVNTSGGGNQPGYRNEPTNPDFQEGEFGFYRLNDKEVILTQYNGKGGDITIPESAQGSTISVIGSNVFQSKDVKSVTFPKTITEIQKYAFSGSEFCTGSNA